MSDETINEEQDQEDILFALLVTNMRLYDVAVGIYTKLDPNNAKALLEAHRDGVIITPPPVYTGKHVISENDEDVPPESNLSKSDEN